MGRRSSLVALLAVVAVVAVAAPASADVFKLFGEVHGGGMYGAGTSGTQKDASFFAKSKGPAYGALVGAEIVFFDAWIQHHQFLGSSGLTTWTQFGLGVHFTLDTGSAAEQKAHQGGYVELGAGVWYGIGTGAQVMPPLDAAQLTDQGLVGEGRIGFGKHLSSIFDLGIAVPVSYGLFVKSNAPANNTNNQYRGYGLEGLLVLRANLRLL